MPRHACRVAPRAPALALASFFAAALLAAPAAGAVISGFSPSAGSINGGTTLRVFGAGFSRGGLAGTTTVYLGNDACTTIDYYSEDDIITCVTPPSATPSGGPVTLSVAVVTINLERGAGLAACATANGQCQFTYSAGGTPVVTLSAVGGAYAMGDDSDGPGFYAQGSLLSSYGGDFYVSVAGGVCDVTEALNNGDGVSQANSYDSLNSQSGGQVVHCALPPTVEAGRYNISLEARVAAPSVGGGQPSWGRTTKTSPPSPAPLLHTLTLSPRVTGTSYVGAGMGGGDELTITGSGFSATAANNVVTLPGGVPCSVTFASTTSLRCVPGAAPANATRPYVPLAAGTPAGLGAYSGGAGLVHNIYVGANVWPDATRAGTPAPKFSYTDFNGLAGAWVGEGDNYGQTLTGYFVPRVTANYSFYCRGDDLVSVTFLADAAAGLPALTLLSQGGYTTSIFDYPQAGGPVELAAGARYPLRVQHQEFGGGDWFQCGLRVWTAGNAAAAAALTTPLQLAFESVPSVQVISTRVLYVREVQTITLVGAAPGGRFILTLPGGVASDPLTAASTANDVASAVYSLSLGCGSIYATRTVLTTAATGTNATGVAWAVTINCPTATPFPAVGVYAVDLSPQAGAGAGGVSLSAARTTTATPPMGGTFALSLGADAVGTFPYNIDVGSIRTALLALPRFGAGGDIEVGAYIPAGNDARDSYAWTLTFWAPAGPTPALAVDAAGLTGPNATASVLVREPGSADPLYLPAPVAGWFETGYPVPAVRVESNGLLAGCDAHKWSGAGYAAAGGAAAPPSAAMAAANPCGFEWLPALTPTVTSVSPAAVLVGGTLTITGTGFLPLAAGARAGPGGGNLSLAAMHSIPLGDGECVVTSVTGAPAAPAGAGGNATNATAASPAAAFNGTTLTCVVGATGAGNYSLGVLVRLGRGWAALPPGGLNVTVVGTVTAAAPLTGSTAGGTVVNVTGSGFWRAPARNTLFAGGAPCVPRAVAPDGNSMTCTTTAGADGASGSVVANGVDSGLAYTFSAAATPVLSGLSRAALSAAVTGSVSFRVTLATAAGAASAPAPLGVAFGDRACGVLSVAYDAAAGGGANVTCRLTRRVSPPPTLPQAPLAPAVYVPPYGLAVVAGGAALDAGFRVASVSPPAGSVLGGATLTVAGAGFTGAPGATRVTFWVPGGADGAATLDCAVVAAAADGSSLTCVMGSPAPAYTAAVLVGGGANLTGALNVTVNGVLAPCGAAGGPPGSFAACGYTFAWAATPVVSALAINGTALAAAGTNFAGPMHAWFSPTDAAAAGALPADALNVVVAAGAGATQTLSAAAPPLVAGGYNVTLYSVPLGYAYMPGAAAVAYTVPLTAAPPAGAAAAGPGSSSAGGQTLTLTGTGLGDAPARVIARFYAPTNGCAAAGGGSTTAPAWGGVGYGTAAIVASSPSSLTLVTPPWPGLTAGTACAADVLLAVLAADLASSLSFIWLYSAVLYNASATPVLAAAASAALAAPNASFVPLGAGSRLRVSGVNFGAYDGAGGSAVTIGGVPCAVANATVDWTERVVNCTLAAVPPAGTHAVTLTRAGVGYAAHPARPVSLAFALNVTAAGPAGGAPPASGAPARSGLGGGALWTINGTGFATAATGGTTSVSVCGAPCAVTATTPTSVTCALPPVTTAAGQALLAVAAPCVLTLGAPAAPFPVAIASSSVASAAAAFDGTVESSFSVSAVGGVCYAGLDFGPATVAAVSRGRFYAAYLGTAAWRGGVFEGSPDAAAWTPLTPAVGAAAPVLEGWNYVDAPWAVNASATGALPAAAWAAAPYFRYVRFRFAACPGYGMELQFVGVAAAAAGAGGAATVACPVSVTVAPAPPTPFAAAPAATTLAPPAAALNVTYDTAATPLVTSVSPSNGTALGGTVVTIGGVFPGGAPAAGTTTVSLNGVPCAVASATATAIVCVTGARDAVRPNSLAVVLGGPAGGGAALVPAAAAPGAVFRYLDRWSSPNTWANFEPPLAGDSVVVPPGQAILVDVAPPPLFLVLVQGELTFDNADLTFDASYIMVHGGAFNVGSEAQPFLNKLTITLHGDRWTSVELPDLGAKVLGVMNRAGSTSAMAGMTMGGAAAAAALASMGGMASDMPGVAGAPVGAGDATGSLEIHGEPRRRVWTKVAATIPAGSATVTTAEDVDFRPGDVVVVTSSSYDTTEAEEATVATVLGPRAFTVARAFAFTHESSVLPAGAYGHADVDLRCEVGLLTRNVVIQGDDGSDAQSFGAHTINMHGGTYRVENVELRRCGQQGQLGRYCTHQHLRGAAPGNYVRFNSIHHSYQRASTVHATDYSTVKHNFAYRVAGHNFFVEDGVERWNVIEENLAAVVLPCYMCLKSDTKPSGFWTSSPVNIWRHNVAAGCLGGGCNGYWFELPDNPGGPSYTTSICPVGERTGEFFNNTARASDKGLRIYPVYTPFVDPCDGGSGTFPALFQNSTFFRNRDNGVFVKHGGDIHHINPRVIETANTDINWVILEVAYGWNPHLVNALVIGNLAPWARPIWPKTGIFGPQNEWFFVDGATLVNFDSPAITGASGALLAPPAAVGAISMCNSCDSDQFYRQGGYTSRWRGLAFVNTSRRVAWTPPFKEILWDLDGTLTGSVNGTVTPYYAYNDWPECPRDVSAARTFDGGTVCDGSTRVRRIQIDNVAPGELYWLNMAITQWNISRDAGAAPVASYDTWPAGRVDYMLFRPKETYGWVFALVTGRRYNFGWQTTMDWQQMVLRYSEPEWISQNPSPGFPVGTGEWTGVSFKWIDARYRNRALYASAATNAYVDMPTADVSPAGAVPRFDDPFGSSFLPNGNKTWHTVLNTRYTVNGTDHSAGAAYNRVNVNSLLISNLQCPPNGCALPPPPAVVSNDTFWSSAASWPNGRVPVAGDAVVIPANASIVLDVNPPPLASVTVQGRLSFAPPADAASTERRALVAGWVVVWGELVVGSPTAPYAHAAGAEIVLTGDRFAVGPIVDNNLFLGNKCLVVLGKASLVAPPVVRAWTRLAAPARAGATTLALAEPVTATAAARGWGAGATIALAPTEYEPSEMETAVIAAVSADGYTLTLAAPLAYAHYAGAPSPALRPALRLAAAVGLLTRSVVVRGNMTGPADTYGATVYVGTVARPPTFVNGRTVFSQPFVGSLTAAWAEFRHTGFGSGERAGLMVQYGEYSLDYTLDTSGLSSCGAACLPAGSIPPTTLTGVAFSFLHNYGLVGAAAPGLAIDASVFHGGVRSTIVASAACTGLSLTRTLVLGSARSPDTGLASQTAWVAPQAAVLLYGLPARMADNYVAASIDAGYIIRPQDCGAAGAAAGVSSAPRDVYANNEAVCTVVGVFALPTRTPSGCGRLPGFVVWKAAHIGIVAVDGLVDLTVANAVVADSHIGVSLNYVLSKDSQARSDIVDSLIVGSSNASATCAASTTCKAYTKADTLAASGVCGSVLGASYRRAGVLIPQYTNRAKTCVVDGGLPVCDPLNRPERLCSMPWEKRYGLPSTRHTQLYLTRVAFSSFAGPGADCGLHSRAVLLNPSQSDLAVPVYTAGLVWENTPPAARWFFGGAGAADPVLDDDAHNGALVQDTDGSAGGGGPRSSILGSAPAVAQASPACVPVTAWRGYACAGVVYRQAMFESMDRDRGSRLLGSLFVTRGTAPVALAGLPGAGAAGANASALVAAAIADIAAANRTALAYGPFDDECPLRFYFGQYPFLVIPGQVTVLALASTQPAQSRFHLFTGDASEAAIFRVFTQRPNSNNVYVAGVAAPAKAAATALDFPTLADARGTALFDPQSKYITFTLRGGYSDAANTAPVYDVFRLDSIQLSFKLSVDVATFYGPDLVNNLATLLGIDPDRVKVVSVQPGSTVAAVEVLPPANVTAALVAAGTAPGAAPALDASSGDGTRAGEPAAAANATAPPPAAPVVLALVASATAQSAVYAAVASLASAGSLASVGAYPVESLVVTPAPPPALSATDLQSLANSTNATVVNATAAAAGLAPAGAGGAPPPPVTLSVRPASNASTGPSKAVLAGAIAGAVVAGLVVVVGGLCLRRRAQRDRVAQLTTHKDKGLDFGGAGGGGVTVFTGHNPMAPPPRAPTALDAMDAAPAPVPPHARGGFFGAAADRSSSRLEYAPRVVARGPSQPAGGAPAPDARREAWSGPSDPRLTAARMGPPAPQAPWRS